MISEPTSLWDLFTEQPTLLRLLPRLGLDVATGMDFLCIAGVVLALAGMVSRPWRNAFLFTGMWVCYFSVFQVMSFIYLIIFFMIVYEKLHMCAEPHHSNICF